MTKKSNPPHARDQIKKSAALEKSLEQNARERERHYNKQTREYIKERDRAAKARDKELIKLLKLTRDKGIYDAKGNSLTPYRRKRLAEIKRDYGHFLDPKENFFLPANKEARDKILGRAKSLSITTTKTGLFFPRKNYKRAAIKYDKKRDEYVIAREGKTKRGPNLGKTYRSNIPLASVDELDRERDRIRDAASRLGTLNKGEVLQFKIEEDGNEGLSQTIFGDVESLLKYLDLYQKKDAAKVNFFRHIEIEVTTQVDWKKERASKDAEIKARQAARKGPRRARKSGAFDTRSSK